MKKFLVTLSIFMSIIFAGEGDLVEKKQVSKSMNEPTIVSIQPNTVPDFILERFIRERINPTITCMVEIEGFSHTIQFIEEIQPNSNWINAIDIIALNTSQEKRYKIIIDWRKILSVKDNRPEPREKE